MHWFGALAQRRSLQRVSGEPFAERRQPAGGLRLKAGSWAHRQVGIGLICMIALQFVVLVFVVATASSLGFSTPAPAGSSAEVGRIRVSLAAALGYDLLLVLLVAKLVGARSPKALAQALRLQRPRVEELWFPGACVVAMYAFVAGYSVIASNVGVEWLEPQSTVPKSVTADAMTLAFAGLLTCLVAPIAEEAFFRGLLVRGLLRVGVWPAIAMPAVIFSAMHFDPGSFVPFAVVGVVIGWLYWRRGSLTDAVVFHFLFNTASFGLLIAVSQ